MKWWQRLQAEIDRLDWSKAELSRRSGISYDSINKYLRGETEQPRGNVMQKLADAIGRPALWLRDGINPDGANELEPDPRQVMPVPVAGFVEAGAFREVDDTGQEAPDYIYEPEDKTFPQARRMAFTVSGDSVNALRPRPILPGDRVICIAYEDVMHRVPLIAGMVVVVERTRDGGHSREWSVKQVELHEDRVEFHPRSSNPRHKPIIVAKDFSALDGTEISVIGIVRRVVNDFPLS